MTKFTKKDVVDLILYGRQYAPSDIATASADTNIALCKYWGKRDNELNLPVNSSVSVSLPGLGTSTSVCVNKSGRDAVFLNDVAVAAGGAFYERTIAFLSLFRGPSELAYTVRTSNNIPTAAGIASSASGFAALTRALDRLFSWGLDKRHLSIIARMGSGSACRSLYSGFVEWRAGSAADGMDSHAIPISEQWPEFCVGLVEVSSSNKGISSRDAMRRTVDTSVLYQAWPERTKKDLAVLRTAMASKDMESLGKCAEANAMSMHATMMAAEPSILYWLPESVGVMRRVWECRGNGLAVYFTMDAGPNVKLLFAEHDISKVIDRFPNVTIIRPFRAHA